MFNFYTITLSNNTFKDYNGQWEKALYLNELFYKEFRCCWEESGLTVSQGTPQVRHLEREDCHLCYKKQLVHPGKTKLKCLYSK